MSILMLSNNNELFGGWSGRRAGVQLQHADVGGGELAERALRLLQHHALRTQHVRALHLSRHNHPAQGPTHRRTTGDRTAHQTEPRRHHASQQTLPMSE